MSSSSSSDSQWSQSRLVPSIVFVLTPCFAVGLLVVWSLRMQFERRRWYSMALGAARTSNTEGGPLPDKPAIQEIWLGTTWEDDGNETSHEGAGREGGEAGAHVRLNGYFREAYNWESVLPVSLCGSSRGDSYCDLGILVRMPSKTPYDEISHTSITHTELNMATLEVKLLPAAATPA
ncbi:hypothetical protein M408DRAFT_240055 [Serendipita vermifera MAFF 305830]|uniref:Uncharacterized protein n=1 Tax=Serendipita vermifera MAFF 305830 TaxID=933852 RepID=A0A0C2XSF1_SERVB|nr:hypothetical protein M408DRAFT_240055 [Serendipita vermifera MAFF 305830]